MIETAHDDDEQAINFDIDFEITNLKDKPEPEQGELF